METKDINGAIVLSEMAKEYMENWEMKKNRGYWKILRLDELRKLYHRRAKHTWMKQKLMLTVESMKEL